MANSRLRSAPGTPSGHRSPGCRIRLIEIADISTGRLIKGLRCPEIPSSGFTATFDRHNRFLAGRMLVVAGGAGCRRRQSPGRSSRISGQTPQAPTISLSRTEIFLPAAQRLAAERRSFNGVRAAVVDVQDIYDEFNYGQP